MLINGKRYQTIWREGCTIKMIDQNKLPFAFEIITCQTHHDTCRAIKEMHIRGAGAIGAAAALAMAQAFLLAPHEGRHNFVRSAKAEIESTRPTAQNLFYATTKVYEAGLISTENAVVEADRLLRQDLDDTEAIAQHGEPLIPHKAHILTHCNAGWLAFVDNGSALAPIYRAHSKGKDIFVYIDETRPRSQGSRLTAWELSQNKIPSTIIPDNAAASLMANNKIDLIIVGADRIAANGDTANKIGTLGRAIVAKELGIPFYVAAPSSTFDLSCSNGHDIPIELRSPDEVLFQEGPDEDGVIRKIRVCAPDATAYNPSFDITPARYITGIITEKGIIKANDTDIRKLFAE